jgi:diguanylate cyclase (GGDEF)-like protein
VQGSDVFRSSVRRPAAAVALTVASAALVAVLGVVDPPAAMPLGAFLSGATAVVSGSVLFARGRRGPRAAPFRRWLGACLVVWGSGQVLQGVIAFGSTPQFPTPGDVLSFLAAPLAVIGVLAVPRAAAGARPALRMLLDSTLLSVPVALLVWRLGFSEVFTAAAEPPWFAVPVLLADVLVTSSTILLALRDLDRHMVLTAAGVACYAVGDLVTLHATLPSGGLWPWQGAVLWCLSWPLIAAGLLGYDPSHPHAEDRPEPVDPDARVVLVTTTAALCLLGIGVASLVLWPSPAADPVSLWLVLVSVLVICVRETLNARLRAGLLQRLHDEASTDPLTGLANRRVLAARLAAIPPREDWCLVSVDLDGFKSVNDVLGHAAGDRLLTAVGQRLREAAPEPALVSRVGGDEFAVLLPGDLAHAAAVARRLVAWVERSVADVEGGHRVAVSASGGVAAVGPGGLPALPGGRPAPLSEHATPLVQPVPGAHQQPPGEQAGGSHPSPDPLEALSAAGAALRMAKTAGRGRVEVFDRTASTVHRRRLTVEERLRAAVQAGEFMVQYQPIVDLQHGGLAGVECLARWEDRVLGTVDPQELIPVAEETGLVIALGEFVLHRSLAEAREARLPERGLRVSCNVSPLQLRVPGFDRMVEAALQAQRVPAAALVLEVTEAVLITEGGPAVQTLRGLADLGVTIAIDDFGTGYSALGYLPRLPAQLLKIDKSLTASLLEDPAMRAITRAVVDLGHGIGMGVVVEGIETPPVAELVTRMGVRYGQGSLYGAAQPLAALLRTADRQPDDPIVAVGG